jgi:hypothetical protein
MPEKTTRRPGEGGVSNVNMQELTDPSLSPAADTGGDR